VETVLSIKSHVASVREMERAEDELSSALRGSVREYQTLFCAMREQSKKFQDLAIEENRGQPPEPTPARSRGLGFNRGLWFGFLWGEKSGELKTIFDNKSLFLEAALRDLLLHWREHPQSLAVVLSKNESELLLPPLDTSSLPSDATLDSSSSPIASSSPSSPSSAASSISAFLSSPASPGRSSNSRVLSNSTPSRPAANPTPVTNVAPVNMFKKEAESLASCIVFDLYNTQHGSPEEVLKAERSCLLLLKEVLSPFLTPYVYVYFSTIANYFFVADSLSPTWGSPPLLLRLQVDSTRAAQVRSAFPAPLHQPRGGGYRGGRPAGPENGGRSRTQGR